MLMFNSNELIKVARLQKLANKSLLNGALVIEIVNNYFSESKKNFSGKSGSGKGSNRKK